MKNASSAVLSLARLLEQQPAAAPACLVVPGLLPPQGILFVGGEPKVGKSLLVSNLALSLAAGVDRLGFPIPAPRRVLAAPAGSRRAPLVYNRRRTVRWDARPRRPRGSQASTGRNGIEVSCDPRYPHPDQA